MNETLIPCHILSFCRKQAVCKAFPGVSRTAGDRFCMQHGADDGFFHALDHGAKYHVHILFVKDSNIFRPVRAVMREAVPRREREGDLAAAVAGNAARARKAALNLMKLMKDFREAAVEAGK